MYIIIVGAGRLGYYLCKALMNEGHEIVLLDKDRVVVDTITEELGSVIVRGDACEVSVLQEVGTGRADMLIAVTGDDEDNLTSCLVAKHKFNVPSTIARFRNPDNEELFKKLGINVAVSATSIIIEAIEREIITHPLTHLLTFQDRGYEIVDVKITKESVSAGKAIKDLSLPKESRLAILIPAEEQPHIPSPQTVLRPGDRIIALITSDKEEELRAALRGV